MQSGQSAKQGFVKRHKPLDMMLWKYFIIINMSLWISMNLTCAIPTVPLITFYTVARKWSLGIITNSFGMTVVSVVNTLVFIWTKNTVKTDMSLYASWIKNLHNIKTNISETFFTVFSRVIMWTQANISLVGISIKTGGIMETGITGARILIG